MNFEGYTLIPLPGKTDKYWKSGNTKGTAEAEKDGVRYRLKIYRYYPTNPGGSRYEADMQSCRELVQRLTRLNFVLRRADGGEGLLAYASQILDTRGEGAAVVDVVPVVEGAKTLAAFDGGMENRLKLGRNALHALARLHEFGVIHNDIKLENVLYLPDMQAVLIDFDHACLLSEVPLRASDLGGTEAYQAPETVRWLDAEDARESEETLRRCREAITPAADVYAMGVLLYRLISGRFPKTDKDGFAKIGNEPIDGCPPDVLALLRSMTDRQPGKRPTADEAMKKMGAGSAAEQPHAAPRKTPRASPLRPEDARLYALDEAVLWASGYTGIAAADTPGYYELTKTSGQTYRYPVAQLVRWKLLKKNT